MDGQTIFLILMGLALVLYVSLFVGGKHYLKEYFQSGAGAGASSPTADQLYPTPLPVMPAVAPSPKKGQVIMEYVTPDTVAKNSIQSVDDYEMNYVFQNENDRELSMALRNKLMSQRPMDWAGLPSSSAQFQAGAREAFESGAGGVVPPAKEGADPFSNVDGSSMVPPDTLAVEMEERKLLQAYQAPTAQELSTYDLDAEAEAAQNPEELVKKIYEKKGLIPTVAHKAGTNVYEVVGVRKKDEKIVYEDEEAPAAVEPVGVVGEGTISVPAAVTDMAAAKDPYYDATAPGAGSSSRMGRWNYQAWTPGLERMFAPDSPRQDWY